MPVSDQNILLLGGTTEATELAQILNAQGFPVTTSLAGRTANPSPVDGNVRSGGYGGIEGLSDYITQQNIALIIDATHPFARQISANAQKAADQTRCPLIRLERTSWQQQSGDKWQLIQSEEEAARLLPAGARAFLGLGRQHIAPFQSRDDVHFIMRMIDPAEVALPRHHEIILAKPADYEAEFDLLRRYKITHLVCRNSGGSASYEKIRAARELAINVLMIERPTPVAHHIVEDSHAVLRFVDQLLGSPPRSTC
ncbi:precorrin-6A/cobalt-precorrin-6A reductase [Paenochrobactrum gallinarii]|uniref:Precorrin-6A/cobalt-precorrin-6A reductase n=1 Tax=Paenochrobactrum gallinarii TaxID=643673 RepID=A0A841LS79_9HYPH|nr:cobalt-precorrin-6A reductase [Paenochrobactrum gallinarii]MBB6259750.1 precorrin-6A/cobalt-precorrin-6A reductase [Paenochrobactrum gallinarii]